MKGILHTMSHPLPVLSGENSMKLYTLMILALLFCAVAHSKTIPFPDSEVPDLFNRGFQTVKGEVSVIRIASRNAPERSYFAAIGDTIGSYTIDRVTGTGKDCVVYVVKSNETIKIPAHTPSNPHE